MDFNILASELTTISANAVAFASKGKNDRAKDLEELLSNLYEILLSKESDFSTRQMNNNDYDFSIENKYFQVTIRKDGKNKLNELIDGIDKRIKDYENIEKFTLIFFRAEKINEKEELINVFKAKKYNFDVDILFLNDVINIFAYSTEHTKEYRTKIDEFYSKTYSFLDDQNGPEENNFSFINRKLSLESKKSGEESIITEVKVYSEFDLLDFNLFEEKHLVIHGDPASGKTSLLKHLFYECRRKNIYVFYCPLRTFEGQDFKEYIGDILNVPHSVILIDASDEVPREYIKKYYNQINRIFLNYRGRIITTVRTSCLNELVNELKETKYEVLNLNLMTKDDILNDGKARLSLFEFTALENCLNNVNTLELCKNPFYYQNIIDLIKEGKNIETPFLVVENTVERSIEREYNNHKDIKINKEELKKYVEAKSYFLVKESKNFFESSGNEIVFLKQNHLFVCLNNKVYFTHNIFKEYFCACYLYRLSNDQIIKRIAIRINKKYYLIPRFNNVLPFLLDLKINNELHKFLIENFPETIVDYPGSFMSEDSAISLVNSLLNNMNRGKYWGDDSLFSIDKVGKFLYTDLVKESVINFIDSKYFRTSIIYSLRLICAFPPTSIELTNKTFLKIKSILKNSKYINDEYLISCGLDAIGSLRIDREIKHSYIDKYIATTQSQIKHALLSMMKNNDFCDNYPLFIADCSYIRMNKNVIDGTLDYLSQQCILSFTSQESFEVLLNYYIGCAKNDLHLYDTILSKIVKKILDFPSLSNNLKNNIIELISLCDHEKIYISFLDIIKKFDLAKPLFLNVLATESLLLFDGNFITKIFDENVEEVFVSNVDKTPYLKVLVFSLCENLKNTNQKLYEKFTNDLKKLGIPFERNYVDYSEIKNKVFNLLFEDEPIKKILLLFYDTLEIETINKNDIRNNKYKEKWSEFPDFVYRILSKNVDLQTKSNINTFDFSKYNIFEKILNMVDVYGCEIKATQLDFVRDSVIKWFKQNKNLYSVNNNCFYINNQLPTVMSLILRYDIELPKECCLRLISIPGFWDESNKTKLSDYICKKITKEEYISKLKNKLLNNELYDYKISEFLDFLIDQKIIDLEIADYVLPKIANIKEYSNYMFSTINYLQHCQYLTKTFVFFDKLSDDAKLQILDRLPDREKIIFGKKIKYFHFSVNMSLFIGVLSCGRKDFFKSFLRGLKKKKFKTGDHNVRLKNFDFSALKLVLEYYKLVLKFRNVEGHYYDPLNEINGYFMTQSDSIKKTNKIIKKLDNIFNNTKNKDFTYYRTLEKKIINYFLNTCYKIVDD